MGDEKDLQFGNKVCADDCKVNFLSYLLCSATVRIPEGEGD